MLNGSNTSERSALSERVDRLIAKCRRRGKAPTVGEVEALYTDGCAEILMLEAEQRRVGRRLAEGRAPEDTPSTEEMEMLSQRGERVASELAKVRSDLRQLRAALEWAQSGSDIEQSVGFESVAPLNGAARR